jgi:hypothetical protein
MPLVEIKNINRVFMDGKTKIEALKNISFDIDKGEIFRDSYNWMLRIRGNKRHPILR